MISFFSLPTILNYFFKLKLGIHVYVRISQSKIILDSQSKIILVF